jgi:hypothetical protein
VQAVRTQRSGTEKSWKTACAAVQTCGCEKTVRTLSRRSVMASHSAHRGCVETTRTVSEPRDMSVAPQSRRQCTARGKSDHAQPSLGSRTSQDARRTSTVQAARQTTHSRTKAPTFAAAWSPYFSLNGSYSARSCSPACDAVYKRNEAQRNA